jgi:hypothetical protein
MTKLTSNVVGQIEVQVAVLVDLIGLSSSHRVSTPSSGLFRSLDSDIHPTHGQVPFKVGQADGLETFASVGGTLDRLGVRGRMYDVVEQVVDNVKDGSRGARRRYDGEEEESESRELSVEREGRAHDEQWKIVWWGNERVIEFVKLCWERRSKGEYGWRRRRHEEKMLKEDVEPSKSPEPQSMNPQAIYPYPF